MTQPTTEAASRPVSDRPAVTAVHQVTGSPLGPITLVARGAALVGCYFGDQRHRPAEAELGCAVAGHPLLERAGQQLTEYFAGGRTSFDLRLDPAGTTFQRQVWQALLAVPFGALTSYGRLAAELGRPGASRAVGAAVGRNPVCLFLPCHRVLGSAGTLTGYAGGLARKTALLELEGSLPAARPGR